MGNRSVVEEVAGSLPVEIAATSLAGLFPWPAALLPVLTNSLAHGRARRRIEQVIVDLNARLTDLGEKVKSFSDAQYQLTADIVAVIYKTIDEEKLGFLKAAVLNVANSDYTGAFEAHALSKILRDISPAEIHFLMAHQDACTVSFASPRGSSATAYIDKASQQGVVAVGLINLGLLVRTPSEGLASDAGGYVKSPLVPELLRLLQE